MRELTREEERERRREERRQRRRAERKLRHAERERQAETELEAEREARRAARRAAREAATVAPRASRPTGRWTSEERAQGWLLTRSQQWSERGRVKIEDKAGFLRRGREHLEYWKYRAANEAIPTAERKEFMGGLYDLATHHGHVCGKWMVFAPVDRVDALWVDICKANVSGKLGGCCKVCTFNKVSGTHLICVYCRDFNDVHDCQRVLYALHNICAPYGVRVIANFKADFLTALGVYKSRSANIACSYTLTELGLVKEWPNRRLKRILDNLKRHVRDRQRLMEENNTRPEHTVARTTRTGRTTRTRTRTRAATRTRH